jgi:F-type H+-transporting ATPase subunit b
VRSLIRFAAPLFLVAAAVPAEAAEGGGSSLIEPKFGTIFWTVLTFGTLLFLLRRYAWKPLLGALGEREKSINESIEQARRDREQAESLLQQQRELLEQSRRERAGALNEGRRDAEKVKAEILEEARAQREKLLRQTEAQVQAGMRQARTELRGVAVDLALRAAEKLLTRNLDEAAHRKLIEDYLADLESSEGSRSLPS